MNILVMSDPHINSTVSLISPKATMPDGVGITLSAWQSELWKAYLEQVERFKALKKTSFLAPEQENVVVVLGDAVEADAKDRSKQLITRDEEQIVENAVHTLEPLCEVADRVYWIAGTEAHVGGLAKYERALAGNFDNTQEENGVKVHQYLRKVFDGKKFDLAHHVGMGNLPWSEKNAANKLAAQLIFDYADWGEDLPDYALRGHVHRVSDSGMNYAVRAITAPCWTGSTSFIHRIGQGGRRPHIGNLVFKSRDGVMSEPEWWRVDTKREGWR